MTITFVTTNKGKVESLRRKLPKKIEIESMPIELPELQAGSASEVVFEKAKEAYKILKKPLLIHDGSFHIIALNGFPGAYIKYILKTINIQGIMKMMTDVTDRECYFEDALAYTEDGKHIEIFTSRNNGTIAYTIDMQNKERAWSDLWKVFIPNGSEKTLSAMTEKEIDEAKLQTKPEPSAFTKFSEWISTR